GTKLRALYQRRKGRDLYDLFTAIDKEKEINCDDVIECYKVYMEGSTDSPPSKATFARNLNAKLEDEEFLGDTTALLRPGDSFDHKEAAELVKEKLINKI